MPFTKILCCCCLLLSFSGQCGNLYQVRLKNGDLLSGELQSLTVDKLTLKLSYAGVVQIDRSQVQSYGPLSVAAATAPVAAAVPVPVPEPVPTAPVSTSPVFASAAPATPAKTWSLQLDLSAATRAGSEDSASYSLTERSEYLLGDWRFQLDANYDYETKASARKTHKYSLSPGVDYFYDAALFWRLGLQYDYNYLASDYKNIDASTGPGYAVWRQGPTRLDLVLLLGRKNAYFRDDTAFRLLPDYSSPLQFDTASLEWDFSHKFIAVPLEIFQQGSWLELLNQPFHIFDFERELKSELGLRYALSDRIRVSWSWQYDRTELSLLLPKALRQSLDISDSRHKISIGASF